MITKPKVLLIDDNPSDRELIARMLDSRWTVIAAASVSEGLTLYRREHPECVLLDHHMPGTAGLDGLLKFVQQDAAVIMVTGAGSDELASEAFKRGARDYVLKKHLTETVLQRMVLREVERRRLEIELLASRERFDEVAARIAEVLWVHAPDGRFLYLSPSFEQVWGLPREGITMERWEACMHPEDRDGLVHARTQWASGVEHEHEFRILRPADGLSRRIRARGYPIFEDGVVARVGGMARDVTEETRLQQELRLAQKLEAIGQLAAGIAHEINTPAQYVSDNVAFLEDAFAELRPILDACGAAAEEGRGGAVERLSAAVQAADLAYLRDEMPNAIRQSAEGLAQIKKIVLAMKEFSHPSDEAQTVDLNRAIENTVTVARNEWKYVADLELNLGRDVPPVVCYPSEINQAVLNILVNAAHAIADAVGDQKDRKGKLTIMTRADGNHVTIAIADTGTGIPDSIRDRIFDPFFTTKGIGKGTGQGLAIVHRIVVEHHRGSIEIQSEIDRGTRFVIRLPIEGPARCAMDEAAVA